MLRWSEDDESKSLLLSVKVRESEVSSSSVDASLSASDASDVNGDDVFPAKEVACGADDRGGDAQYRDG